MFVYILSCKQNIPEHFLFNNITITFIYEGQQNKLFLYLFVFQDL